LSSITVDEGNNTYDSRNNCNAIVETATNTLVAGCKNTIISNSVTSIGKCAFQGYSSLTSIDIPNSVTSIGYFAFSGCGLTSITIPSSVTAIGWGALDISSLTSLTIMCTTPPDIDVYNPPIFTNRDKITLYVPANCKSIYEEESINGDYWWKGFKEIIEIGENPDIDPSDSKNTLKGNGLQVSCGTNVTLPIKLNNELEVRHCQFDLQLPAGITVATKSNGKLDAKLTERAETHSISSQQLSNGNYRFIISSMDNDSFTGNSGTLVEITLDIPATMEAGEYTIKLLNAELSVPDGNDLKVVKPADTESKLTVKAYTPGDVNNDGSVSVTDVGCAINYILEQVPSVFVFEAADMNGDKSVSVTDVGMIINLILNEGAAASPQMNRAAAENAQLSMLSTTEGYQLQLGNKDVFIGFQMDVQVANSAAINDMKLMGGDDHLMTYRQLSNGMYRVVCYSPMNNTFVANDDALLNIAVNGNVIISNVRLTTVGLSEVCIDGISAGTTGITDVKGLQGDELKVYSLDGRLCRTISKESGENPLNGLKAGVYMIGNRKVVVR
jgi:hypothetical protein